MGLSNGSFESQEYTLVKRRLEITQQDCFPAYVVWELTLACDQPCAHCGSRAGAARQEELDLDEALKVVEQLADMKAREVVLIGGEAYLYDGFLDIIAALKKAGIRPVMTTGGRGITGIGPTDSMPFCMETSTASLRVPSSSVRAMKSSAAPAIWASLRPNVPTACMASISSR